MADSTDHTGPDAQLREVLEDLREDPDALIEITLRQAERNCKLTARVGELEQTVRELKKERDRLREERAGRRQAAPFGSKRRSGLRIQIRRVTGKGMMPPTAVSRSRSTSGLRFQSRGVRSVEKRLLMCARSDRLPKSVRRSSRKWLRWSPIEGSAGSVGRSRQATR